ncbi:hypothetical protein W97_08011 [Coniosporium apollinis CBS 100218]|uniref:Ribosomal RNA-processing protein 43 n=1 Tax=Coniosporium apollinis (strain CBS 100218) TaxID=1168221 RepID=R7Z3T0_CONA1|nr:uncharacterized protein W97_08011 [Coniosporium apollinis CBS 100218]EON68753.1 hypothetical protein W97_08011 [Coniosporium apollinis CBS 100218]
MPAATVTTSPTPTPLSFPAPIFAALQPSSFLRAHLAPDSPSQPSLRANGRRPSEFRKPNINTGSLTHSHGSAVVRIGDTAVVAGVRGEILLADDIPNPPEREKRDFDTNSTRQESRGSGADPSSKGGGDADADAEADSLAHLQLLVPNLELSTGCHPSHLPGSPPSSLAQSLAQRILSLLHSTRLVPLQQLRILRPRARSSDLDDEGDEMLDPDAAVDGDGDGKVKGWEVVAYWTLYIDILFISLDGAVFDAAWGAVVAALGDTRLPHAWWDADRECVLCEEDGAQARGLGLRGCPVAATVGVFAPGRRGVVGGEKEEESWMLVDLDAFEEGLCREVVTVVVDCSGGGNGRIHRVEKNGGGAVGMGRMRHVVRSGEESWRNWAEVLGELGS